MNNHGDCFVCGLLWSQYLHATVAHLKLETKLQNTNASRDKEAAEALTSQL
jgi:hypothetical protein